MSRQPNNLTIQIMPAFAPFALAAVAGLASLFGVGCGKSRADGVEAPAPPSTVSSSTTSTTIWADSDGDGIPDAAELRSSDDRASFRQWFAYIAEMQFYRLSDTW